MASYDFLIYGVCIVAWILVLLPAFFYLIMKAGWAERRQRILANFTGPAVKHYFELYFPKVYIKKESNPELVKRFEAHYRQLYGRRHLGIPLLLLAVVAGLGLGGTEETLRTWPPPCGQFFWPQIILSAFLGAFTWVVSDLLSRSRRRDLGPGDIYNGVFRFLIAAPFAVALAALSPEKAGIPVAFLIGVFPTTTLFTIGRRVASKYLGLGEDSASVRSDLEMLQNVGKANAERFSDEGVTTIAELAWTDPVDLAMRTNFDFNYVTDCMSQALLAVYVGEDIKKLAPFSLRGAQEVASLIDDIGGDIEPANPTAKQKGALATLTQAATALSTPPAAPAQPTAVLTIDPKALWVTLKSVAEDPYTKFISAIW